ncbi:hypothetical protein IEQ_05002 [Bacillus cereus BAG6X1-2]|nr:hypothetical protein IEQ_05002 [Bacillus cereus BAG6X1-2]
MNKLEKVIAVLKELRISAASIDSEIALRNTMKRYNMLFIGSEFKIILSSDLHHCLIDKFECRISEEDFLSVIPIACESLEMKTEAMYLLEDCSKIVGYSIQLF